MIKVAKSIAKIVLIFIAFFFVINLAEQLFDMELESYTIVIIFVVVASTSGVFNSKKNWK